jgi:GntR family transcriptional regulator
MAVTRYEQTVQMIEQHIVDNKLEPGDRLPSETEIAKMAGVSLITVRRAMVELTQSGFVRREQGRGTYVQATRIDAETTRLGSLSDTLGGVHTLTTEILSVSCTEATSGQLASLQLNPGATVWEVRRLRRINGEPAIVELAAVPAARARRLDDELAHSPDASLYRLLKERYGLEEGYEEQTLVVRKPDPDTRDRLGLGSRDLAVIVTGTSYTRAGAPFDAFHLTFDAKRFAFHLRSTPQDALVALTAVGARSRGLRG